MTANQLCHYCPSVNTVTTFTIVTTGTSVNTVITVTSVTTVTTITSVTTVTTYTIVTSVPTFTILNSFTIVTTASNLKKIIIVTTAHCPWLLEGNLRRTYSGFQSFRSSIAGINHLMFRDCLTALFLIPDF